MTAGTVISLALAAAAVAFVVGPLLRRESAETVTENAATAELQDLYSRHAMTLASLKDLDDDLETGKLGRIDYEEQKARLTSQAVETLQRIDSLEAARPRSR